MSEQPIRVLVVDDHAVVREGIRHVLESAADFQVVGEAESGADAMALAVEQDPDVVILDVSMPGESGLKIAERLRERVPTLRILFLSMHDQAEYVLGAVRAGAQGYLLKDAGPAELRDAVRTVFGGQEFFSPAVARQLSAAVRGEGEEARDPLDQITAREREVLIEIADGKTNKQIAAELGISPRTVETHRESLMRKLRIRSVAGLTRFALETGIARAD